MKSLSAKVNVDNTDPDYPNGKSVDDTGSNDGTPVNFERLNDMDQFFEQLMVQGGVTPNGLPENDNDGYQLIEALYAASRKRPYVSYAALISQSGTNDPTVELLENTLGTTVTHTRDAVGEYSVALGAGSFPASKTAVMIHGGVNPTVRSIAIFDGVNVKYYTADATAPSTPADSLLTKTFFEIRIYD